uniref:Uncharacterized protein n=1 Tax=Arundo donax TaxID=35708 RepID=A0A0A9TQ28_ARUDO
MHQLSRVGRRGHGPTTTTLEKAPQIF